MPDTDPKEFTDREKFILAYYRDRELSRSRLLLGYDVTVVLASVVCLILAAVRDDAALGFVAYALVVGRLSYIIIEGRNWAQDFQNIFRKYDAKLNAAAESHKKEGRNDVA